MGLPSAARSPELVFTEQKRPSVSAEDEVDVALSVYDKRGSSMVIEGSRVDLIRRESHEIDASPHGASPGASRVGVSGHVRVLMRPLVSDIGHAVKILGGRMLHVADGLSVAVVAEVVACISRPERTGKTEAKCYYDSVHGNAPAGAQNQHGGNGQRRGHGIHRGTAGSCSACTCWASW